MRQPLFGVSTVGYRLEGGFNGAGEPANQWLPWELARKVPSEVGRGPELWVDPDRVLDLASSAGAEVLALGLEWSRIEPAPGRPDNAAIERYASIFRSAEARGMRPIGVLHDIATPSWLGEEFWLTPGSPDRFAEHVARLTTRLAGCCRHWVTLRQPNLVALAGWVDGRHPPRRVGALADAWAVVDNLLTAHVLAYAAIHDAQPDAVVLFGLRASASYDWHGLMVDLLCAPSLGVERGDLDAWIDERRARHDRVLPPRDLGDLAWRRLAGVTAPFGAAGPITGRLRRLSPRRALDVTYRFAGDRGAAAKSRESPAGANIPEGLDRPNRPDSPSSGNSPNSPNGSAPAQARTRPLDALLVVWRPPHLRATPGLALRAAPPWKVRPDPDALTECCREQVGATPGLPLWVEDGFATREGSPRTDGWDRRSYLRAQLAAAEAVPVAAYLYSTLEGGGDPTWPDADFGLHRTSGTGAPADAEADAEADTDAAFTKRLTGDRRREKETAPDPR